MRDPDEIADLLIVGGGIVGLACAHEALMRHPRWKVLLLEKEPELATHQSGRNSGVIHSGLYYPPGSAKARLCRAGREQLLAFCEAQAIPFDLCGKVVVATHARDLEQLELLLERGQKNGVDCVRIDANGLRRLEPHAAGLAAIHVRDAGIVDYRLVAAALARKIEAAGGEIRRAAKVLRLGSSGTSPARVYATLAGGRRLAAHRALACAGLHADRLSRASGLDTPVSIVPFRGEYHLLAPDAAPKVRGLIYPVPDPRLPFLGVHLTRQIDGRVSCGPNAVLALAREGYRRTAFSPRDALEQLRDPGLRRLVLEHLGVGLSELHRSFSRRRFARDAAQLLPGLRARDLRSGRPGLRAQALFPDGRLADDFVIVTDPQAPIVHVLNAPSPAATASLAIAVRLLDSLASSR